MLRGDILEDRPSFVEGALILNRDLKFDVIVSLSPIFGKAFLDARHALGEDIEMDVRAGFDDPPHLLPPFVRLLEEGIGGHVDSEIGARGVFVLAIAIFRKGLKEIVGLLDLE
jgi:hypothetical protein